MLRVARKHPTAERAPEALLAAATRLRRMALADAQKLPKVEKLLARDVEALTLLWDLLKKYPAATQVGAAVDLVTQLARFYATRDAAEAAMTVYRQLLANVPDAAAAIPTRFNLAGLYLARALEANRKLIDTGQKDKAKALSADFKAALDELHKVLADQDPDRSGLRGKAVAEVRKVAGHFQSLEAWDVAAGVLAGAAKAAAAEADKDTLALVEIDLRIAQGHAALSRLEALGKALPANKLQAGHLAAASKAVAVLIDAESPHDPMFAKALDRLDQVAKAYSGRRLWAAALDVYGRRVVHADSPDPRRPQKDAAINAALALREARLLWQRAQAEFTVLLATQHRAAKLPLTEFASRTLQALGALVQAHPAKPQALLAVGLVRDISRYYRDQGAYAVARKVLEDFAKAHEKARFAESLRLDAVGVSLAEARKKFAEAKELAEDGPPFAAFTPVLAEYKAFIGTGKDAALIRSAFEQVLSVPPLHVSRGQTAAAVQLYEQFLKDFPAYDRADAIWYRIGVTHLRAVLGADVEGKLSTPAGREGVGWGDALGLDLRRLGGIAVAGRSRGRSGPQGQGQAGSQTGSQGGTVADPAARFEDLLLAQAEQQWVRQMAALQPAPGQAPHRGPAAQPPRDTTDDQTRKRQKRILAAAHNAFLRLLTDFPSSALLANARRGVKQIVAFFSRKARWQDAADTLAAFAKALPDDPETEEVVFQIAEAQTAAARAKAATKDRAELPAFVARFDAARTAWGAFLKRYPKSSKAAEARYRRVMTYNFQATAAGLSQPDHAVHALLTALEQMDNLAAAHPDDPQVAGAASLAYAAAGRLESMKRYRLAVDTFRRFVQRYPTDKRATEAALKVAHLLHNYLKNRRRAVQAYQAYLHSYNTVQRDKVIRLVHKIGEEFYGRQEWTGAMMVFDLFLANYPEHAQASGAAVRRGDIFKENGAWADAVQAYQLAQEQYPTAAVKAQVAFRIGQCHENLSQWEPAIAHYRKFLENHPQSKRGAEVRYRVHVLAELAKYQELIDKYPDSPMRHDAQNEIAKTVETALKNPLKAVVEYGKVVENFPTSGWADDAQFRIGRILYDRGKYPEARDAFGKLAEKFPQSSLADDAWLWVGQSYIAEAEREAKMTPAEKLEEFRQFRERELFQMQY
jgi:TolA-binding protein